MKEQDLREWDPLLRENGLELPHSRHHLVELIQAPGHPLPEGLSCPLPSPNLRRSAPLHSAGPKSPRRRRDRLHVQCRPHALHPDPLVLVDERVDRGSELAEVVEHLEAAPDVVLVGLVHAPLHCLHGFRSETVAGVREPKDLVLDNGDAGEATLLVEELDLAVHLGGLGEVEAIRRVGHEVVELAGEAEEAGRGLEEVCGSVEVGELEGVGANEAAGVGDLLAGAAEGGLEGSDTRADGGEGGLSVTEGGELRKEGGVAGEDLGAEVLLEEADSILEGLGSGGGRAGAECLRGEVGRVKVRGEEGGEDGIGGEGVEWGRVGGRRQRHRRRRGEGGIFEGGELLKGR